MSGQRYLELVADRLHELQRTEGEAIDRAARALADALAADGMVYVFGCGHSAALSMDIFYRAGGLMLVEPIFSDNLLLNWRPVTETTAWERKEGWAGELFDQSGARAGDVMIVISTSGRNAAPIDVALAAKNAGLTVIALTAKAYAESAASRHSTGKRLHEAADIVLDNHADPGDAAVQLPGLAQRVGPTSTVLGSALLQAVVVQTVSELLSRKVTPPVFMSSNYPGGDEHNETMLARCRDRIRYL